MSSNVKYEKIMTWEMFQIGKLTWVLHFATRCRGFAARVSDPEVSLLAGYHFPRGHLHMKLAIMTSLQKGVFTTAKKKNLSSN